MPENDIVTPEASANTAPAEEMITVKASEFNALKADRDHWKSWSRKHEDEVETLKAGILINSLLAENNLPEEAKEFLTGKDETELRAKADMLSKMFEKVKPVETAPEPAPVESKTAAEVKDSEVTSLFETQPVEPTKPAIQPNPLAGVTTQPVKTEFDRVAETVVDLFK